MCVSGLAALAGLSDQDLGELVSQIRLPALQDSVKLKAHSVQHISGYRLQVDLPHEHAHRTWADIRAIIDDSTLTDKARYWALEAFALLADAEAKVHGTTPDRVTFHEVGALDSILDICLAGQILERLEADRIVCSPLPICDGQVKCAHGLLASPPPAVQELLTGVPVYGIDHQGETITPTALSLLKAWNVEFGNWPEIKITKTIRAYGQKLITGVPNGAIFCLGESHALDTGNHLPPN
jgi:uncharacterized protein (DUF111 family)